MKKSKTSKYSASNTIKRRQEYLRLILSQKYIHRINPLLEKYRLLVTDRTSPHQVLVAVMNLTNDLKTIMPEYAELLESNDLLIPLTDLLLKDEIGVDSMGSVDMTGIKIVELEKVEKMPRGVYLQLSPQASEKNFRYFLQENMKKIEESLKKIYNYEKKPKFPKVQPRNEKVFIERLYPWMFFQFSIEQLEVLARKCKGMNEAEKWTVFTETNESRVRKEKLVAIVLNYKYKINISNNTIRLRIKEGEDRAKEVVK